MFKKRGEPKEYTGFFARHKLAVASTTLIGTIVGAGILGIPYVVAKTGFLYGLCLMVLIGVTFLFLNLFLGEVVLRTKEQHQLPGYAGKYLGRWGKRVMTVSMLIGLYGALTAYLIGEGVTLHALFRFGSPWLFTLIFFALVSYIVYRGVKTTGKAELFLIILLFLVVTVIGFLSYQNIQLDNLTAKDITKIFIPYGVILFACIGMPAIPEMQEELGRDKRLMKKALIIGSLLPIILYIVFTFIILGMVGLEQFELLQPNQRIATVALSLYFHPLLGIFANLLASLAMFTSFLTIGTALLEIYHFDYGFSRRTALLLTLSLPLLIALFKLTTFMTILALTGAVAGGLDGTIITLMYWKAKVLGERKPEYSLPMLRPVGLILIIMFLLGLVYQLWDFFSGVV